MGCPRVHLNLPLLIPNHTIMWCYNGFHEIKQMEYHQWTVLAKFDKYELYLVKIEQFYDIWLSGSINYLDVGFFHEEQSRSQGRIQDSP